jgi:Skp family chaperone for outer membrane proteins
MSILQDVGIQTTDLWWVAIAFILFAAGAISSIINTGKSIAEARAKAGEPKRIMNGRLDNLEKAQEENRDRFKQHTEEIQKLRADNSAIMKALLAALRHFGKNANGDRKELENAHKELSEYITESRK